MSTFNNEIKRLLGERRPERYTPGDGDTDRWLDAVALEIAPLIPPSEAQQRAARAIVGRQEGELTRDTNRIMREIGADQPPLDWLFFHTLPLVVGGERVAIRAATEADFRAFAREERERADADYAARQLTIAGATLIADAMRDRGIKQGSELYW